MDDFLLDKQINKSDLTSISGQNNVAVICSGLTNSRFVKDLPNNNNNNKSTINNNNNSFNEKNAMCGNRNKGNNNLRYECAVDMKKKEDSLNQEQSDFLSHTVLSSDCVYFNKSEAVQVATQNNNFREQVEILKSTSGIFLKDLIKEEKCEVVLKGFDQSEAHLENILMKNDVKFSSDSTVSQVNSSRLSVSKHYSNLSDAVLLGEIRKLARHSSLRKCNDINKESEIKLIWQEIERITRLLYRLAPQRHNKEIMRTRDVGTITTEPVRQRVKATRIKINIGGVTHETYRSTLKNIPDTRLSWIAEESAIQSPEYDPVTGEFFFDRHSQVFSHILNYYRTGYLHVPYDVCGPLYEEELQYWGIEDSQIEPCCWLNYRQHRDAQETLKEFEGIEFEDDCNDEFELDLSRYGYNVEESQGTSQNVSFFQKWQPLIWQFFEGPYLSKKAKAFAGISMFLILMSVLMYCIETMNAFSDQKSKYVMLVLEGVCVLYFTTELSLRFFFCPNKFIFVKGVMNWIDLLSIIPFFLQIVLIKDFRQSHEVTYLQILRVIRVFRIIKLSKHSVGLQILGHTLKASFRELLLLIFFLAINIVIFSSLVYYCEKDVPETKFISIPSTFWWAVITMTTVGYGDMVPTTWLGKTIGGLCAVSGVLMIALPVPVIVNNFNLYYSHAQARLKLPKKKRRMLCGAANALKSNAIESHKTESCQEAEEVFSQIEIQASSSDIQEYQTKSKSELSSRIESGKDNDDQSKKKDTNQTILANNAHRCYAVSNFYRQSTLPEIENS